MAKFYSKSDFKIEDLSKALEEYVAETINKVARVGAHAMARVIYEDARRLAPVRTKPPGPHWFYGRNKKYGPYEPGQLRDSIYYVYSKDNSTDTKKVYHISWNRGEKKETTKAAPYGHMIEFGTSKAPAKPFLYPAYAMNKEMLPKIAADAMREALENPNDRRS